MNVTDVNFKHDSKIFIHSQILEPGSKVKGVIVLIHGLGEHSGRYSTHFAEYFTKQGFAIVCFDLPGHGKSGGKRGHIKHHDEFTHLVSACIKFAETKFPKLPIFIYGHSLGGLIALDFIMNIKPEINGAIISAPAIDVKVPIPSIKVALAKIMNKLFPSFTLDSGLNRKMLSRDKSVVERYNADPLVHGMTSSRLGMYIINTGEFVKNNPKMVSIPTMIMIGSADGIVNKHVIDTFCDQCDNCQEKVWDGLYHELHNEPEKKDVLKFAYKWFKDHS